MATKEFRSMCGIRKLMTTRGVLETRFKSISSSDDRRTTPGRRLAAQPGFERDRGPTQCTEPLRLEYPPDVLTDTAQNRTDDVLALRDLARGCVLTPICRPGPAPPPEQKACDRLLF